MNSFCKIIFILLKPLLTVVANPMLLRTGKMDTLMPSKHSWKTTIVDQAGTKKMDT